MVELLDPVGGIRPSLYRYAPSHISVGFSELFGIEKCLTSSPSSLKLLLVDVFLMLSSILLSDISGEGLNLVSWCLQK